MERSVIWFEDLGIEDVERVGGKNASLGEMIRHLSSAGVRVPGGFATTAQAYRDYLEQGGLQGRIDGQLASLDVEDVELLAEVGATIRGWILETPLQPELEEAIGESFRLLEERSDSDLSVAVRSSATAEDLPEASFAGQQETFLNVRGLEAVLLSVREVFASLFNDRAIAYRRHQGFEHSLVALSAGVQRMVRSDLGASGVMFTLDTESGFKDVVLVNSSYGLGELLVQGAVNPDEFHLWKPALRNGKRCILKRRMGSKTQKMVYSDGIHGRNVVTVDVDDAHRADYSLTESDLEELGRYALAIEDHYQRPMDIEWAKDGADGTLHIVQARPETVRSRDSGKTLERYRLKERGEVRAEGRSIGQAIAGGMARVLKSLGQMSRVREGDVLVTDMTDPDWEPVMKRSSAIVTNRGGRTCHAAIIARELGIPAVVGCGDATRMIEEGEAVTISCAEGETGFVYAGLLDFEVHKSTVENLPSLPIKIMMNVGNPDRAYDFQRIPHQGVGLARLEFIINRSIGIHPKALLEFDRLEGGLQDQIRSRISGYSSPVDFYVEKLVEGIATIGAAFAPETVIVRLSDFKSNEYANLIGGRNYEPVEENPMLGFRGASRYVADSFRPCFEMECRAIKKVRGELGLTNVELMIPFVRTLAEAREVNDLLAEQGLRRGEEGLRIIMMCELPSNALLADQFLEYFDGFSIGSNDLTQLTLGLDRDSGLVAESFDERDPAVKALLRQAIQACKKQGKYIGICGQGPSDYPDFARWLVDEGIESVSLNPDSVVDTWLFLGASDS